jgi:hypothetical protein
MSSHKLLNAFKLNLFFFLKLPVAFTVQPYQHHQCEISVLVPNTTGDLKKYDRPVSHPRWALVTEMKFLGRRKKNQDEVPIKCFADNIPRVLIT